MAEELKALCPEGTELALVPKQVHNEAFYDPKLSYWNHVIERIGPDSSWGSGARH
jgi:hypothetical protein